LLRVSCLLLGAGLIALAGCNDNNAPPSPRGATKVLLIDAPFPYDQVARVDVYIVSIQASTRPDTGRNAGDTIQTGLRTIVAPHRAYNLLDLASGATAVLGEGTLLSGEYVQVRLTIDTDSSSITLKNGTVLKQGSGLDWRAGGSEQFGVNAFTDPPLEIPDSGAIVVIDFNLGQSFRPFDPANPAAGFTFIGFVSAINSARSGSVSGTVTGEGDAPIGDASVTLWVPNPSFPTDTAAWAVVAAGKTDASGVFRLPYVGPGTYVASVEPPSGSPYGVLWRSDVAVTVGQETRLGTIAVGPAPAAKLAFRTQPSSVSAGTPIVPAIQVAVVDASGNTVLTATNSVTVAIGTNPPGGTLSGTTTVAAAHGVATFSTLSIDKAASGYTLTAAATGLTSANSDTFTVTCSHDCWTTKASMPTPRYGLRVGVVNGILYAVGGNPSYGVSTDVVEAYDPVANTWTTKASMPTPRSGPGVGVIDGILYAVGGSRCPPSGFCANLATVEAYDRVTNTWTTKASMPTPRYGPGVGVIDGVLYAVGGFSGSDGTGLAAVEAYDPVTDTWTTKASMATPRYDLGVGVINGILYAVGGYDGGPLATVEAYDPVANTWTTKASLPTPLGDVGADIINGVLYAVEGLGSSAVEAYDPGVNTWTTKASMPTPLNDLSVGVVNGVLYAVGGYLVSAGHFSIVVGAVEAYQP